MQALKQKEFLGSNKLMEQNSSISIKAEKNKYSQVQMPKNNIYSLQRNRYLNLDSIPGIRRQPITKPSIAPSKLLLNKDHALPFVNRLSTKLHSTTFEMELQEKHSKDDVRFVDPKKVTQGYYNILNWWKDDYEEKLQEWSEKHKGETFEHFDET